MGKVVKKKNSWWALMKERKRESNCASIIEREVRRHAFSLSFIIEGPTESSFISFLFYKRTIGQPQRKESYGWPFSCKRKKKWKKDLRQWIPWSNNPRLSRIIKEEKSRDPRQGVIDNKNSIDIGDLWLMDSLFFFLQEIYHYILLYFSLRNYF